MQNDTDLIFEAYKEIYSEGWKEWLAGAGIMLTAALGGMGINQAATEFKTGLPKLTVPQPSDSDKVDAYLGKVAKISGLDLSKASDDEKEELQKNLKKHYEGLKLIKQHGNPSQQKSADHIIGYMKRVSGMTGIDGGMGAKAPKYNLEKL
jgi:hypothetical protein